jgi:hypothetical protein
MTKLDYTLPMNLEYENRLETEKLYSILNEQDQILDFLHQNQSQRIAPETMRIDDEEDEKENSYCSRRDWLGNPDFYNQLQATKEVYHHIVEDILVTTGKRKVEGEELQESAKKQKVGEDMEQNKTSNDAEENWDDEDDTTPLPWQDTDDIMMPINHFTRFPLNPEEFIIAIGESETESDEDV